MPEKKIIAELEVQTGRSVQNLHGVTEELSKQETAGVQNATAITHALQNIENATASVIKKEQDGRVITERDGKVILQQYEILETAVKRFAAAGGQIGPELQRSLATARGQLDLTAQKIRTATDAVSDQKEKLQEGGVAWSGMSDQVNKALGKFGSVQVAVLAFAAAAREGWQIGTQFAQAIGTNFQAAESAANSFKQSIASVTNAFVTDGFVAGAQQVIAHNLLMKDTLLGTGRAMEGFNALIDAGVSRREALKASTQDLIHVSDAHRSATQGGTEALRAFNDTVRAQKDHIDGVITSLESLGPNLHTYAERIKAASLIVDEHTKLLKHEIDVEQNVIQAHDDEGRHIDDLIRHIDDEEGHRRHLHDTIVGEIQDLAALDSAQNGTSASIASVAHTIADLTDKFSDNVPAIEKEVARLGSLEHTTRGLSDATRDHIDDMVSATRTINALEAQNRSLKEGQERLLSSGRELTAGDIDRIRASDQQITANQHLIEAAHDQITSNAQQLAATDAASTGMAAAGTVMQATGDKADGTAGKVSNLVTKITDLVDPTAKAATKTDGFHTALNELQTAFHQTDVDITAHITKLTALTKAYDDATSAAGRLTAAQQLVENAGQGLARPPSTSQQYPTPIGPSPSQPMSPVSGGTK